MQLAPYMQITGNLRKMDTELVDNVPQYMLGLRDVLDPLEPIDMNALIGENIKLEYQGYYNSVLSGEKMNKPFGEGLTYKEFMESPQASPSIMRPELSQIHEGVALRDYAWEVKHHLQPHVVYISLTSNYKVGRDPSNQYAVSLDRSRSYAGYSAGRSSISPIGRTHRGEPERTH